MTAIDQTVTDLLAFQARTSQEAGAYEKFLAALPAAFQDLKQQKLNLQAAAEDPAQFNFAGVRFRVVRLGAEIGKPSHFRIALERRDRGGAWCSVSSRHVDQQGQDEGFGAAVTEAAGARDLLLAMLSNAPSHCLAWP